MAWSASVISKSMESGVVFVTIEYSDGSTSFRETYRSGDPTVEWVQDTARVRIAQIEKAAAFTISTGAITPTVPPAVDPKIALFRSRCRQLDVIKNMIDMGAIAADHAKVVALVNWIKTNAPEYMDYI